MIDKMSPKPWLRTLPDYEANVVIELITRTRAVLFERMRDVDFARVNSFSVSVELQGRPAATVLVRWHAGCLEITLEGVSRNEPFTDQHGRRFTALKIGDTPSIADTGIPIVSVRSVADRLDYWLDGLRSPHHQTIPERHCERITRFLDRLAIAVDTSEPDWDWLYVEPCRPGLTRIITVVFDGGVVDFGIGMENSENELHPELARDIFELMSQYTEVRLDDVNGETDLRVHIGDMGIMSLWKLDAVGKLRLHARCSDRLTLYAHPRG